MRQILQNLRDGSIELAEIPCPAVRPGHLLIRTRCSLVSVGTERMLLEFGKAHLLEKARQQPDKLRMVFDKARTDGVLPTLEAVSAKLNQPLPLGYCNVGRVLEVGAGVSGWKPGDRVVSNGRHAEIVNVPLHLCARVEDTVSDDEAAFTVLGAIALQGIRLAEPTLGEAVVVMGLGLIGLLAVQLLRAQGCRVLGLDFNAQRLALAARFGAETMALGQGGDPVAAAQAFSRGRGVDAVLITAATRSNAPVRQAAAMCRQRGRIVLVGVAGLDLARADFYAKELTFQVSCSYGPGRYDPDYEERGRDYPVGFVRWTLQRNLEAVMDMLRERRLDVMPLISHRFSVDDAADAYRVVSSDEAPLGIVLDYPGETERPPDVLLNPTVTFHRAEGRGVGLGFIGAGNYANAKLIPAFKAAGANLHGIASAGGTSALHAARRFGFALATTDTDSLLADASVKAVVISTRHDSHADLVCRALGAHKHVFVEKPLALDLAGLERIQEARKAAVGAGFAPLLMVGFNRRFSPHAVRMRELLRSVMEPRAFVMTINAGSVPEGHWTRDPAVGGGRIIGEACHFIDLLRFLAGAAIVDAEAHGIFDRNGLAADDRAVIHLRFAEGSLGTIHYLANGHKAIPKERLEVFTGGRVLQLDNFRRLRAYGWPGSPGPNPWRQDKGQEACARAFLDVLERGGEAPVGFDELLEVSRVAIVLGESLR